MAVYNGNNNANQNNEVSFRMVEKLGVLEHHKSGWALEVNIVSWNGNQPKIDIRDWDPDHERMGRGITLHERQAVKLTRILAQRLQVEDAGDDSPDAQADCVSF